MSDANSCTRPASRSIDERAAERFVMMERRGAGAVAPLALDSLKARSSRRSRRRRYELPCSGADAEPIDSVSRPSPSPNAWMRTAAHNRSPTERPSSAVEPASTMMSFPSLPPDMVVGPQRMPDDLGHGPEARFGGRLGCWTASFGGSTSATRTATGRFGAAAATAALAATTNSSAER